jgi:hypothetical protein
MALAVAELYALSAALCDDAAAAGLSAKRGDAACDSLPLEPEAPAAPAAAAAAASQGKGKQRQPPCL